MYDDGDDGYYGQNGTTSNYDAYTEEVERPFYRYSSITSDIPEQIKQFIQYFHLAIKEKRMYEIQDLYENTFPKLSEEYFDRTPWPDENSISHLVEGDRTFLVLYKELYFRHLHARLSSSVTLQQRFDSFSNYCNLFNLILLADSENKMPLQLELPDVWLWELIDEFVYQFQAFSQYKLRPKKTIEEIDLLSDKGNFNRVWNVLSVLNVLHSLIDVSNIKKQLEVQASGGNADSVAGVFGKHSLYKMLGYFSLVGLLRLHSLLGDYYQAVKALENIEIHKKSQYSSVPACQITMAYYVGFAYMMMRRYADAIRTFSSVLLYLQRAKQLFQSKTYQNDQINKQTEQMYNLLSICLVLHPQYIDESIQQALRDKSFIDKIARMQSGDIDEFESCFLYACPKFLCPTSPSPETIHEDHTRDATKYQARIFLDEVRQQEMLPTIRSYLKLYKTLPLSKLATFMRPVLERSGSNIDTEKELTKQLLCFKHKMKNMVWTKGGSGLDGSFQSGSELDFYIDNDMIHIADTKVATRHADLFIRKIQKFDELRKKLQSLRVQ
ncbi:eukaryotic translation initiation factor 3 subunit L [Planococcus citri]|uniref:eukaryotic translation initiation factor 3 subunit L n=1 Tax=Planococcus citri TaxID=170843 RepID=UPI0031F7A34C